MKHNFFILTASVLVIVLFHKHIEPTLISWITKNWKEIITTLTSFNYVKASGFLSFTAMVAWTRKTLEEIKYEEI